MAESYKVKLAHAKTSGAQANQDLVAAGDNSASAKQRIQVLRIYVTGSAACTIVLLSNTTAISPVFELAAGVPLVIETLENLKTSPGEALKFTTTGSSNVAVMVEYRYVP